MREGIPPIRLLYPGSIVVRSLRPFPVAGLILLAAMFPPTGTTGRPGRWIAGEAQASEKSPDASRAGPAQVQVFRLAGPIRIDGILDEPDWQRPSLPPLVQNDPDNGRAPREATEWWLGYDDDALYLACRMHDAAPESIRCGLGRRDSWPSSDWLWLDLDTFNDDRTGYEFAVSPAGAIADGVLYSDGAADYAWDGIWQARARVDRGGWTVEMRIPFSQLRFPNRGEQVWGVNLARQILRFQERDDLMPRPRGSSGYVSRFPDLVGLGGIHPGRRAELLTYGVGRSEYRQVDRNDPFRSRSEYRGDLGSDLKVGLARNLTLDATLNPDFGQVEVDPAVVNLSDFETYFEEKRPFFVENSDIFRFGQNGTSSNWNFNWSDPTLFYSRRIGHAPQVSLAGHDYADVPSTTTIVGAARADGRVGPTSVGILGALTARETARLELAGLRSTQVVEPRTGYLIARALRARSDGRRGLGIMATETWRDLADPRSRSELTRSALVWGADGWTRLDSRQVWALRAYLSGSHVLGSAPAVAAIQRSSLHYYQRPDARQLHYDSTRTSLGGLMGRVMLNKQSGNVTLNTGFGAVAPGYHAEDAGFTNRSDVINWHLAAGYQWVNPGRVFRYHNFNLATYRTWDTGGNPDTYGYGFFWNMTFANYWSASGNIFYNPDRFELRDTRGGPAMRIPRATSVSYNLATDDRKPFSARIEGGGYTSADGSGGANADLPLVLRPRTFLTLSCTPSYSWSRDFTGWVTRVDDPAMTATYGARYIFSRLIYREASLSTRIDWTFTPRLTLQTYVQPLIGVAAYREFKELARPRTYSFDRFGIDNGSTIAAEGGDYLVDPDGAGPVPPFAFSDPDFNYKSLKVNVVLRWEYQPGSTVFLVWTQGRTDDRDPGSFDLSRDVRSLFAAPGDNTVMVKVTKWMGF